MLIKSKRVALDMIALLIGTAIICFYQISTTGDASLFALFAAAARMRRAATAALAEAAGVRVIATGTITGGATGGVAGARSFEARIASISARVVGTFRPEPGVD